MPDAFIPHGTRTPAKDHRGNPHYKARCDDEAVCEVGETHRLHDLREPQKEAVATGLITKTGEAESKHARIAQARPQIAPAGRVFSGEAHCDRVLLLIGEPGGT